MKMTSNDPAGAAPVGSGGGTNTGGNAGGESGTSQVDASRGDETSGGDETSTVDATPPAEEEAAVKGPRDAGALFTFDTDSDFNVCEPGFFSPPCWQTSIDIDAGGLGGTIGPVADEAVVGHLPARALAWTGVFPAYDIGIRLYATFAANEDWTARTKLHFQLRVASGLLSLNSYELFIQGGFAASYGSIYQTSLAEDLVPGVSGDEGSTFHDLSIDLTSSSIDRRVLLAAAGLGVVLHSVTELPSGGVVPPPTVIEIDNVWLE
jgi:hypothetical protein